MRTIMNKRIEAGLLFATILLAAGAVSFVPSGVSLTAGKNKLSALSESPNPANDWLIEHDCRTIKSAVMHPVDATFGVTGMVFTIILPPIMIGVNLAYRYAIKKWPRCEGTPYTVENSNRFFKCCYALIPGREVLLAFATFLVFAAGLAIAAVEVVAAIFNHQLSHGFYKTLYACWQEDMPDTMNQIIKDMAKPVTLAARAAGHATSFFLVPALSVLVLFAAKIIGFRREQQAGERQRLIDSAPGRAAKGIRDYGTGF